MFTAQQICSHAREIAKCAGYTTQSGQCLQLVLDDLVLHRDLKVNRKQQTLSITAGTNGPFNLTADYLRTYDLFFLIDSMPFFLTPLSQEQYDALFKSPAVANYPYNWTTDLTPQAADPAAGIPLIYVYPQTSALLSLTHRFMVRRASITTPESSTTVPWFPDQDYLIHATAMRLMKITGDARYDKFLTDGENMLRTHIIMDGDEQQVVKAVRLDPQRFRMRRSLKPTKVTD